METIGLVFGLTGFIFGLVANRRLNKLEDKLKELDVLDKDFKSGERIK